MIERIAVCSKHCVFFVFKLKLKKYILEYYSIVICHLNNYSYSTTLILIYKVEKKNYSYESIFSLIICFSVNYNISIIYL